MFCITVLKTLSHRTINVSASGATHHAHTLSVQTFNATNDLKKVVKRGERHFVQRKPFSRPLQL